MNKKHIKNIVLILAVSVITITFISSKNDISNILETLRQVNINYLLIALGILIIHWLLWSNSLSSLIKRKNSDISNFDNFLIASTDLFFNGITPYASGGQPFQLYAYTRVSVKGSDATSSLTMNFIVHQTALMLISTISLIFYYGEIARNISLFSTLLLISYIINFTVLGLLFMVSLWPNCIVVFHKLINLLCKIKFFNKLLSNKVEEIDKFVVEFQNSFWELLRNKFLLVKILVIRCFCLIALYSIPFFIIMALNLNIGFDQLFFVIALSSLNYAVMACVPIPGGSGGAEAGMSAVLMLISGISQVVVVSTMLIWRFLTYYLTMLYGLILYIIFEKGRKKCE